MNVDIEGHTDNTGSAERNAYLSQQRADVCKNYLVKKELLPNGLPAQVMGI
ncbi:MAG: OmpA family protein [Bacteroidota bacterium]|nr:MAG: OmpA family protein [Bacteroidota bacterium]